VRGRLVLDLPQPARVRRPPGQRDRVAVRRQREVAQAPRQGAADERAALEILVEPVGKPTLQLGLLPRPVLAEDPLAFSPVQP
jgi:hypothetical protein